MEIGNDPARSIELREVIGATGDHFGDVREMVGDVAVVPAVQRDLVRAGEGVLRRFQIVVHDGLLGAGRAGHIDGCLRRGDALLRRRAAIEVHVGRLFLKRHVRAAAEAVDVRLQITDRRIRAQPTRLGKSGATGEDGLACPHASLLARGHLR